MIRKLAIQNFRCIRDVEVELEPLTAFVGPNASGKSAFLAALDPRVPLDGNRRFNDPSQSTEVVTDLGRRVAKPNRGGTQGNVHYGYQLLRLDLNELRANDHLEHSTTLSSSGGNLINVYETLERREQVEVSKRLCELIPVFDDLDSRPLDAGRKTFRFHDRWSDARYGPGEVSDGTMLMLAFLLIPFQRPRVDLLCIEEPERGLHPYLMEKLVDQLRDLSAPALSRPQTQVLLATQSAELLNHLRPEEVRFLRRRKEDGSVEVKTPNTSSPTWSQVFGEYEEELGSMWMSGGLGGVPG